MVTVRGHRRDQVTREAARGLVAAAVALLGRRRGSHDMHDATSPRQARSSGRHSARPSTPAKEADMIGFLDVPGRADRLRRDRQRHSSVKASVA
jgi:dienelactone hydrolase